MVEATQLTAFLFFLASASWVFQCSMLVTTCGQVHGREGVGRRSRAHGFSSDHSPPRSRPLLIVVVVEVCWCSGDQRLCAGKQVREVRNTFGWFCTEASGFAGFGAGFGARGEKALQGPHQLRLSSIISRAVRHYSICLGSLLMLVILI